jgi:deazaflavin-dependent oxidoreductase (nitroreductase family)
MIADTTSPTDSRNPAIAQHARRYAETGGTEGHIWNGVPTLLLTTTGRRSGLPRRTALIYGRHRDSFLIVASNAGADQHPDWYLNLRHKPQVRIQILADLLVARARLTDDADRNGPWSIMTALWPDYERYQAQTSRIIPIVELDPIGPSVPSPTLPTRTAHEQH